MEETIELRELIKLIWNGRIILSISVIFCMLVALILNWFILEEKYESNALVQVVSGIQDTGAISNYIAAEFKPNIYAERIQNKSLMQQAFDDAGIKKKFLPSNLTLNIEMDTLKSNVALIYTSSNAQMAQNELQVLIDATKKHMNEAIQLSLKDIEELHKNEIENLSNNITEVVEKYNNIIHNNDLPEILILQTIMDTESEILINASEQQKTALSAINGDTQSQLLQLQAEIQTKSTEYKKALTNYQSVKMSLDNFKPDPFIRVITEPTLADYPTTPNKMLNLALGVIIGFVLGLGIIFFRNYWKNSAPIN
ncbi:Wzz/FepE/Etk N-terminal domain-containing protein [Bacillus ndiopicus]|uniref:Wzz/FepE/Etk N-terminal domain-containing protein n=1 Tax=Bacillus ndiopicus TaxID=1347368 RepID=UPI0005A681E2|nr:Wzz/FepE/Etk N-terminal domain-containing protein [Bacillus ndiopicus]